LVFIIRGELRCWVCAAVDAPILYRSLNTAAVVRTILIAINIGPALLSGELPPAVLWKVPLNYVVPFCVATWGAVSNSRAASRSS
jgi:hypothetical protein